MDRPTGNLPLALAAGYDDRRIFHPQLRQKRANRTKRENLLAFYCSGHSARQEAAAGGEFPSGNHFSPGAVMPEPREHMQSRGWIESILRRIPGFKGYLEKEYRRDSDALQRSWLADRLQRAKPALDAYGRALVDAKKLDQLTQLDHFKSRLDKTISRLRGAMQGYSGFFDLVQVNEALLDRVYQLDVKTMDAVDALAASVEKLSTASADTPAPLAALNEQLSQVDQAIDHRQDMLKGLE
jgi:hypothetical protein